MSESLEEVKEEQKKKIKLSKPKKILLLEDKEENDNEFHIYTNRGLNLKNKLSETRFNVINNYVSNDANNTAEDVFDETKINNKTIDQKDDKNETINDLIILLNDVRDERINNNNNNNNKTLEMIEINDSIDLTINDSNSSVSMNTRSKKGNKKKNNVKKSKKNNKKNNKSVFNEKQMFERLDGMECLDQTLDEIQILEDIEEIEAKNTSITGEEVEQFMNSRRIEILVKYSADIKKFSMKRNDKFCSIMPLIAEQFNEDLSNLVLRLKNSIISADSSPQSIGLIVSDIIDCDKRVFTNNNGIQAKDPNILTLKLRDSSKTIETIIVSKFDEISKIMAKYSEKRGFPSNKFILKFDGERLEPNLKVADCDIEDESQIDVIII